MIEVDSLHKSYRSHRALNGVSFSISQGVVGFLGPNGAGKSTTMKILAGCLAATSGSVTIHGHDVLTQSRMARRFIGYMPETTPLEMDMKVADYLIFRAGLKEVPSGIRRQRLGEVAEQCEISDVLSRRIGNLSKGYKQRVGLADALIHDPAILILDEPTSGLDPNQIRSVRQLIRNLGQNHTVLLSSHILGEIESTCDRVLILHQGEILADDSIQAIKSRLGQSASLKVVVGAGVLEAEKALSLHPGLESIRSMELEPNLTQLHISFRSVDGQPSEARDQAPAIARRIIENGWNLFELSCRERNLEEVFSTLTNHSN